jgi:hypothetical protein
LLPLKLDTGRHCVTLNLMRLTKKGAVAVCAPQTRAVVEEVRLWLGCYSSVSILTGPVVRLFTGDTARILLEVDRTVEITCHVC